MSPGSDGSRTIRAIPLAFPAHPGIPSRISPGSRAVLAISFRFSQVSIGGRSPELIGEIRSEVQSQLSYSDVLSYISS